MSSLSVPVTDAPRLSLPEMLESRLVRAISHLNDIAGNLHMAADKIYGPGPLPAPASTSQAKPANVLGVLAELEDTIEGLRIAANRMC